MYEVLKKDTSSVYPEAHKGPLGNATGNYAKDRKYKVGPEYDLQKRIIIWGLIFTIILVGAIILFVVKTYPKD